MNAATTALAAVAPLLGKPSDLVFTTASGGPVRQTNFFAHVWQPACAAAGLAPAPGSTTCATPTPLAALRRVSPVAVQDQLGHESMETTRKVYAELVPAVGVAVCKAASAALERGPTSQSQGVGTLYRG